MPVAVEQFDLSSYNVIVSNCHATSKGVITGPEQLHISYIHTPIRYAWDMQNEYLEASRPGKLTGIVMRVLLHYIRLWDMVASSRPDVILANSSFIAGRIKKIYRRESQVLHPPVDVELFPFQNSKDNYYLAVSRLVPYKRMDLIMDAFRNMPDKKLIVIGDGPDRKKIKEMVSTNIQWLGYQSIDVLRRYLQNARAFIFAAKEDFGITPLEAQACGTPVIAFRAGGAAETIRGLDDPAPTGVFFSEQTSQAIQEAVHLFELNSNRIQLQDCRKNAERFSNSRFKQEFSNYLDSAWNDFQKRKRL
jgi:glycosyltransferase involved in cell wall biosynthesis